MHQPEQWGLLVTMLNRAEAQEAGNEPHFRYLRSPAPPAASRGCIWGLRRHRTRGWPSRRVAPSPCGAAADRGRNPGSSPGARPGSAARLPPGPGALLGPSARRAPAGGPLCARTYGRRSWAPRSAALSESPVGPFQNRTPCVRVNWILLSNPGVRC